MSRENDVYNSLNNYDVLECSKDYNLWSPLSSSKNPVFTAFIIVFPKLSSDVWKSQCLHTTGREWGGDVVVPLCPSIEMKGNVGGKEN